jgi:hypothetical protein
MSYSDKESKLVNLVIQYLQHPRVNPYQGMYAHYFCGLVPTRSQEVLRKRGCKTYFVPGTRICTTR